MVDLFFNSFLGIVMIWYIFMGILLWKTIPFSLLGKDRLAHPFQFLGFKYKLIPKTFQPIENHGKITEFYRYLYWLNWKIKKS